MVYRGMSRKNFFPGVKALRTDPKKSLQHASRELPFFLPAPGAMRRFGRCL